jgi:hypothetical protein
MTTFDATIGPYVQQAPVNFSSSGNNTIITGLSGTRIRILQFFLVFSGAVNVTYYSGTTALSGPLEFAFAGAQVQDFIQLPLTCNEGDSFIINLSAAVQVGGTIWYAQ